MPRLAAMVWVPASVGLVVLGAICLSGPATDLVVGQGWFEADPNDPSRLFLKVFRRLLLIPLLVVLGLWLRPWRDGSLVEYGLHGPRARWRPALLAFALAWLVGGLLVVTQLKAGWLVLEDPLRAGKIAKRFGKYLVSGFVIGFAEEWFFRGWLWRRVGGTSFTFRSAFMVSLLFGFLHAFRPGALEHAVTHDAAGAVDALFGWFGYAFDVAAFGPRFLGLALFGLLLCAVYRRTANLWVAIALHAGCVGFIYTAGAYSDRLPRPGWVGSKIFYDGVPLQALLVLLIVLFWRRGPASTAEVR